MEIDTNKPCPARIYDYWLGGTHNFPVDRAVGKQMEQTLPFVMQALNLNRWFVEYAGRKLTEANIHQFLDLGAGLPTEGALHTAVPTTSKVIYVEADPEAVAYSQQILRDEMGSPPNVKYIQGRIQDISPILEVAEQFFDSSAPVGICLIGVTWFLDDDSLRNTLNQLYQWAAPGSLLAVSGGDPARDDLAEQPALKSYKERTGANFYLRSVNELVSLFGSWQPLDGGLKPFEEYAEAELGTKIVQSDFRGKVGYAGFFSRPA